MEPQDVFNGLTVFSTALGVTTALVQLRQTWQARVRVRFQSTTLITAPPGGKLEPTAHYAQITVRNNRPHAVTINSFSFVSPDRKALKAALGAINDPLGLGSWQLPAEIGPHSAKDFLIPYEWLVNKVEHFKSGKVRVEAATSMGECYRSNWVAEIEGNLLPL